MQLRKMFEVIKRLKTRRLEARVNPADWNVTRPVIGSPFATRATLVFLQVLGPVTRTNAMRLSVAVTALFTFLEFCSIFCCWHQILRLVVMSSYYPHPLASMRDPFTLHKWRILWRVKGSVFSPTILFDDTKPGRWRHYDFVSPTNRSSAPVKIVSAANLFLAALR